MVRSPLYWLLALIPVSLWAELGPGNDVAVFLTSAGAILPLAGLIGRATDQLALRAGPRVGGLMNATFGNVAELIIAVFLLVEGEIDVVKASLTGSILGNLLLVLGLSFFVGGVRYTEQRFSAHAASVHAASLTLAVMGLLMPALFALASRQDTFLEHEVVSAVVASVLIVLYVGALVFTLVTHEHLFRTPMEEERPQWSLRLSLGVLAGAAALTGLESELLVGSLGGAVESLGLSKLFVGLIVVPIVGNAAEHGAAVLFAVRNKLDISLEIAIGSSVQIALFVAPALVFISLLVGHPMDFFFSPFEVAALGASTLIVWMLSHDGETNWLEGAQLLGAYVIMAISFFFVR